MPNLRGNTNRKTYVRVEPQLAHGAWDDLFLLGYQRNAKSVVDDGLLNRVHLQEANRGQRWRACLGWDDARVMLTGLFITVSLYGLQLRHAVTFTVPHTHTFTQSYRVEVWEQSDWRSRLDRKRQEWFHHHGGTSGTDQPWQRTAHCTTHTPCIKERQRVWIMGFR